MVGVPGKYKGCETCRRRRVKCTNERPYCQKCISSGRPCEGYAREMVFITGTPESKGRVASHPRKTASAAPRKRETTTDDVLELDPIKPLRPAWDDYISLSSHGIEYQVLLTALQTSLQSIVKHEGNELGFKITLPPYSTLDLSSAQRLPTFSVKGQCHIHLSGFDERKDYADESHSYCALLFEHMPQGLVLDPHTSNPMLSFRPDQVMSFPNHHYFIRVYRPLVLSIALLTRRETPLSSPEWRTIPWSKHPKSPFDQLLDIVSFLPSVFQHVDRLLPLQATMIRRSEAQGLLHHCLHLERELDQGFGEANRSTPEQPLSFWTTEMTSPEGTIPFSNAFAFKDGPTGLMFLYYWMSQILLHRCIDAVHRTIFQPIIDAYPNMWPDLPPVLQIDPMRYQRTQELAANICRGLDSVLDSIVQPDMLIAPVTIATNLYREMDATSQDGVLEIIWLESFKQRLVSKGNHISGVLQENSWFEIATF